ncbi:LysR substrate-binding domain-containing protein [Nodularia spumigena CS-584]|uniref:HTH-type transcriptional activator CmpR n=2 Tax=Nodularia spumigena TaxID=70799 RepID=A0A2S0QA82_NODSP|nr:LysR family transcriptional regulator [Nodularia spumigena]AHJ30338.1 RuBisCO operon transcriptional regulator [Nodularia spumigena CCY9414]AVZ31278.1 HTH-type transcriptional activator CmpR [Nodularia spumigena UHCC 0039]MDB9384656.1 LysR substrate-binding domain-containing protein [Nodularia spumigena CS-584]MEA5525744.1 LysR substrate-binding domain-containing protein [Nodularia spumigena UHCC 0143]MEA5558939.1 LysR substrate-binding domain-containing protein [Nodularia spumigena CH309]
MKQATLHQLKVFEAAARHSSFTRAAEELFLTQPTVSMQIKQLTKSVGLPLFEQVGKRLFLTEAGRELFATCRQIFETIAQFEMTVADLKGLKQGQLRLAVITTAKYFVPRLLGPFCQLYPGIEISLQVTNHEGILERMNNNMDDLYIMSQVPENLDVNYEPFLDNPLVVFAPVNHPLAKEKNIPIERLTNEPFIMREPGSGTRRAVQQLFDEYGVKVKVKLELGSNEAIKQAIAGGLGISVLSRHTLMPDSSEFSILDVEHFPIKRTWYMVHPPGKQLSIVARTYYEYLLEAAKKLVEESGFSAYSKLEDVSTGLGD